MYTQREGCPRLEAKGSQHQRPHQVAPRHVYCNPNGSKGVQEGAKAHSDYHFGPALTFTFSLIIIGLFLFAVLCPDLVAGWIGWHRTLLFTSGVAYAAVVLAVWAWTAGGAR